MSYKIVSMPIVRHQKTIVKLLIFKEKKFLFNIWQVKSGLLILLFNLS
jgi:hypothetical protein